MGSTQPLRRRLNGDASSVSRKKDKHMLQVRGNANIQIGMSEAGLDALGDRYRLKELAKKNECLKKINEVLFKTNEELKRRVDALERDNEDLRGRAPLNETTSPRVANCGVTKKRFFELASELEELQDFISRLLAENEEHRANGKTIYNHYIASLKEKEKISVKAELDQQHLELRGKLVRAAFENLQLEETLNKRNADFEVLENNNKELLDLLEKFDTKVSELQDEVDLKDIKIK